MVACMDTNPGLLALITDPVLRDEVDRVAAAAGIRVVHPSTPAALGRKVWSAAAAVVLGADTARGCVAAGLPPRGSVFLVTAATPVDDDYRAALSVGARSVLCLPAAADDLVGALSTAAESPAAETDSGAVLTIVGGKGGVGASVFAAAVALRHRGALLVDADGYGGGIDLLLGAENLAGLRWPDLTGTHGRLSWAAVRQALPEHRGVHLLAAGRGGTDLDPAALESIIEAGRQGGTVVVCDVPRGAGAAAAVALQAADLLVLVCSSDIRAAAATAALASAVRPLNPNIGLAVRGPSPGGLRAADVAEIAGLPVLASMRPEPLLAERLERGGLRLRPRSPLGAAADRVLATLIQRPGIPRPALMGSAA